MSSNASLAAQNKAALEYLIQMPVTKGMVSYLAAKASSVIRCEEIPVTTASRYLPPTPPATPPQSEPQSPLEAPLPTVEEFITSIVQQSHVGVQTLMPTLVYLTRLQQRLPHVAKGMRCTVHRIFLASLILAAKNLNDSSPKNKYWARYTAVPGYESFGFSNSEVNLMEKQLLFLLDWDLRITTEDLYTQLEPFLAPIRVWQQRQAEKAMRNIVLEREAHQYQQQQHHQRQLSLNYNLQPRRSRLYDSPQSISSYTGSTYSTTTRQPYNRSSYPSRHSSHIHAIPTRTPSLSPPTRSTSASSSIASSSPASLTSSTDNLPRQVYTLEQRHENLPPVVHIPAPIYAVGGIGSGKVPHSLPFAAAEEEGKPAKKLKTSAGGIFARFLGGGGVAVV